MDSYLARFFKPMILICLYVLTYILISNKHRLYLQQIVFLSPVPVPFAFTVTKAFPQNPEPHAVAGPLQALAVFSAPGIIIQS